MSRSEHDREDLLREATALVRRVEIRIPGQPEPIVLGFRRGGELSIFLGFDRVWQFDAERQLRRGHWEGRIWKVEAGKLVELTRRRTPTEVQLLRRVMSAEEEDACRRMVMGDMVELAEAIRRKEYQLVGQVPPEADVLGEFVASVDRSRRERQRG